MRMLMPLHIKRMPQRPLRLLLLLLQVKRGKTRKDHQLKVEPPRRGQRVLLLSHRITIILLTAGLRHLQQDRIGILILL
jgi:hypothetical protein